MALSIYNQPWRLVQNRVRGVGGREIDKFRGVFPPLDDPNGSEAWIGSVTRALNATPDNPVGCSKVVLPDSRTMYLFEAIALNPEAVLGRAHMQRHGTDLGMLVKYLDAKEQYILQAHPTRAFAKKTWGSDHGKEESWYVLGTRDDTAEPAYIFLGFKEGVTRAEFEKYYRTNDLKSLENLCHRIEVRTGDVFFVGGGVPHALGEGCFVIEVQEPSDITVVPMSQDVLAGLFAEMSDGYQIPMEDDAVYDEKLLGTFLYNGCSAEENLKRWRISNETIREGSWGKEYFLIGPKQKSYFSYTQLDLHGECPVKNTGFPQVAIVIDGEGVFSFDEGRMLIHKADELFLPFNIPGAAIVGDVSVVFCHPEGAGL